jgi:hypothetical protein
MDENVLNMEIRKFLKQVGIISQRKIEQNVENSLKSGSLKSNQPLKVSVTLTVEGIGLHHEIEGEIRLE